MSTRESAVFARLKARITRPTDRFERIENGLAAGWPDVNYCFIGSEGWIEIKAPTVPVKPDTALFGSNHPLTVEQHNWFLAQARANGRGFLFIATQQLLLLIDCRTFAHEQHSKLMTLPLSGWRGMAVWKMENPSRAEPTRWFDLREILCTRDRPY